MMQWRDMPMPCISHVSYVSVPIQSTVINLIHILGVLET